MKKTTLFLIMLGFWITASAQYDFSPIVGPVNVAQGSAVTINLNDTANSAGVSASSSGAYDSFTITVDWSAGGGGPWSSEADITFTTTAGSVTIDPPTTGGGNNGGDTTLTFSGDLAGAYDPTTDGYIDIVLNQSFGGSDANWSNIVITLFEAPTCIDPSGMTASMVTATAANLDWTAGLSETDWNIEYNSVSDFTPGNGEAEVSVSPSGSPNIPLTGLNPATDYYVYYQANCGTGDLSLWVGPYIFTTECVTFVAPYTEGFENGGTIPLCWSMDGGEDWFFNDNAAGTHVGNNGTITGSTASNNYFAWCDASGNDGVRTLTSPLVDVAGLAAPALSFYLISDNEGNANSNLDVEVWDGTAWNPMATYNTNTGGWALIVIDLSTLTITGDVQARFIFSEIVTGDFYDDIAIDDVTFDEAPSCFNPASLTATAITANSAELSWSQDGSVASWNIEIVTSGTAPTGTPTYTGVTNPYTVTGLTAVTAYDYYVQANCGSELSGWTGPFAFETLCDVYTPDYLEQFTTIIPDCWDEADSGDATTGPGDFGAGAWGTDGFLNNGFTGAYKINLWLAAKSDWILSPQFDLTGGPFQVEFDFGIMQFGSSTNAGTLGSDDIVQLLITNDNGITWTPLLTYDNTSVVSPAGEHPVVTLEAYAGQTVQFGILGSEGTVDDPQDNDVFVDNFRVRGIPTCPEPTDLTSTNLSLTSTEVGWTETGASTAWNIEYGPAGFTPGTGTLVTGVATNPYVLDGLTSDTDYDFYVQAVCDPMNISSFAGPGSFYTGYCQSEPSSNDGQGVTNVTIGITDFPSLGDVTYEDQTSPTVNVFQGIETNVAVTFATGFTYDTNIWIDFNDDLVFDNATELVFSGTSTNANPTTLDASFVMPLTAPLGVHRMRIGTADFGQATPNPCYNGSWGVTLDFTVNIQELLCTLPEATYTTVPDCANNQFFIDVDVTSLGDASSLEISNDFDASTLQALATGVYQAGPFPFGSAVNVFVMNEQDNNCTISSDTFELLACPPDNDNCAEATVAVVNTDGECTIITSGTLLEATPSGVPSGSCSGDPDDDVWFEFVATDDTHLISLENISGSSTNLDHGLYEGACGSLTEIYCSTDDALITPTLTVGNTYYVRVFSAGSGNEDTTFDLCIRPGLDNVLVDQTTYTVEQLVQDILIGGECAQISNITYSTGTDFGEENGIGYFSMQGDGIGFPFDEGIILTTGDANLASGPNVNAMSDGSSAWPGDTDLENAVGITTTNNATIIEFDFVPLAQEISFDFLMASEEYNGNTGGTFECTFSDAFAFLLTDSNGVTTNLAVLPNTTTPILVTNIHLANPGCDAENEEYFGGYIPDNLPPISFDGRTTVFTAQSAVNIGETYHIKLVIADQSDSAFDSGVFLKAGSFDLGELDLGEDITIASGEAACLGEPVVLDTGAPNLNHFWFKNGIVIDGENSSTLTVTEPDLYTAQVIFSSQCFLIDEILVEFLQPPALNEDPSDLESCSATGEAPFFLSDNDTVVLGNLDPNNHTISYHLSESDADTNTDAITDEPYTNISNPQTVYVRVEDNTTGCHSVAPFDLIVIEPSHTADSVDYTECGNGIEAEFDLASHALDILNEQDPSQFIVSYHTSQVDAENGENALPNFYTSSGETVYVRVESVSYEGCYVTNSFELIVGTLPLATFDPEYNYEVCPNATVPITIGIIPDNFTAADVSVTWLLDGVVIAGASGLALDTVLVSGDYSAEITFNATGCTNTITTTVAELDSCIFPEGISPGVSPGLNDRFDLSSFNVVRLEIYNRNGTLVYSKNNYVDEWEGQTNDGEELPVGTYFYTVVYEGGAKTKSAWVYINR
ncbi:choice-of-anchor L domain-containing protein [Winogradskyella sp. HB-48]|uniref:choice-of-anchor L domain-containing protein n=1 Tax=Winogradskyella sp. HB-48 TaxID=3416808 RepID=UPI003CFAD4E4